MLRVEAKRRGQLPEREVLRTISAEWRREHGLGVLIDKAVEHFEATGNEYKGLVIASLRNSGEAIRIHELGGIVVWTDADPKVRYQRIHERQRTVEDEKTFEQFIAEEAAEMQHSGDAATLDMAGVKSQADIFIRNDKSDIQAFKDQADKALTFYVTSKNEEG